MSVTVLAPGLLTCVQDSGRSGHAASGVGSAGAMDCVALRLANALVGNVDNAACLEMTLRGPRLRFETDSLIAVTGAEFDLRCGGASMPMWRPVLIRAGGEVDCGGARRGARAYLAVAGGIDVPPLLGSRSTDINAAIGPCSGRALGADDVLTVGAGAVAGLPPALPVRLHGPTGGDAAQPSATTTKWSIDPAPWFDADGPVPVALVRGAHFELLDTTSRAALFAAEFRVGSQSNRVGYRLDGPNLALNAPLELISEGVTPGTMQLPPDGNPIVLMAEAPTTGGYPRIAHVASVDLGRLAQRRPGDRVRFAEISLAEAQSRYLVRNRALATLGRAIAERLGA